ncbi:hypothetical protein L1887_56442 [Cichorium endivia]|nr:hypothetical protein L1887_56442 [Cichorium endivia]
MSCLASVGSEGFEFAIRGRSRPVAGAARGVSLSTWSSDAGKSVAHTIIGPCTLHLGSSSGRKLSVEPSAAARKNASRANESTPDGGALRSADLLSQTHVSVQRLQNKQARSLTPRPEAYPSLMLGTDCTLVPAPIVWPKDRTELMRLSSDNPSCTYAESKRVDISEHRRPLVQLTRCLVASTCSLHPASCCPPPSHDPHDPAECISGCGLLDPLARNTSGDFAECACHLGSKGDLAPPEVSNQDPCCTGLYLETLIQQCLQWNWLPYSSPLQALTWPKCSSARCNLGAFAAVLAYLKDSHNA